MWWSFFLSIVLVLLSVFVDVTAVDLFAPSVIQDGDSFFAALAQSETSNRPAGLVSAFQRDCTTLCPQVEQDPAGPSFASLQRFSLSSASSRRRNGHSVQCPMEVQSMQAVAEAFCPVLHYMPATMAKCDRHQLHSWRSKTGSTATRWWRTLSTCYSGFMVSSSWMASAMATTGLSGTNAFTQTSRPPQECQRSEDSTCRSDRGYAAATAAYGPCSSTHVDESRLWAHLIP